MDDVGPDPLGLLTAKDVAALLKISERQAYRLIKSGAIDSLRVGRALRCTRQAVADFIATCEAIASASRSTLVLIARSVAFGGFGMHEAPAL